MERERNMYVLNKSPNARELNKIVTDHSDNYLDYCRVWFDDNSTAVYYNTIPILHYQAPNVYYVDFKNPILHREGAFGKLGIIRSKRVCKKLLTNKK